MSSRNSLILIVAGVIVVFAVEAALLCRNTAGERYYVTNDRRKSETVDRLLFTDSADAFRAGEMKHVLLADGQPARITLDQELQDKTGFPRDGTWTSPRVRAEFPFTELVPSWNVATPSDTGVLFHVRTRDRVTAEWSPWLRIGSWGRVTEKGRLDRCSFGHVETDTLLLDRPADVYQVRATLESFVLPLDVSPAVRRITVTYSGPLGEESVWARAMHPDPGPPQRWARDLKVPFRAQGDNAKSVTGMTCSPTSVSMVLHHWGINRPTMENCLAIWDDHNEVFGNWSNATQRAAELGLDSWLQRFRNWDQVKEMIARGLPVIASIEFEEGSYEDAPIYQDTPGHLIVIRGFTRDGLVIVNDPASRKKGDGALYPPRGLGHAWFGHGGVGYVMRPPATTLPAALVKSLPSIPATLPATTAPVATSAVRR